MIQENLISVIDAAVRCSLFTRTHSYPVEMSPEFFEFMGLMDKLDTELRRQQLIPENVKREL